MDHYCTGWVEGKGPVCIFEISLVGPNTLVGPTGASVLGLNSKHPAVLGPPSTLPLGAYHLYCLVRAWVIVAFAKCKYEMTLDCVCHVSPSKCKFEMAYDQSHH